MKIEREKLHEIFMQSSSKKEFIDKVMERYPEMKKGYLTQVWYKIKREAKNQTHTPQQGIANAESTPQPQQSNDIQIINPSDITATEGESFDNKGLKEVYGNMFEESGADNEGNENEGNANNANEEANQKSVSISPAQLLSSIAIGINNNLLYGNAKLIGDRQLTDDEKENIFNFSSAVAQKDLKMLEDQPEINWAIASFIVPAINRIDLYFNKLAEFAKKHPFKRNNINNNSNNNKSNAEESTPQPKYTEEQKKTIEAWISQGFKVDPAFDFVQPIDIVAYRDYKIVRNGGSNYS
ncbi:MAG: hypothetical protein QXH07_06790 [Thermoplasmata archaeon]